MQLTLVTFQHCIQSVPDVNGQIFGCAFFAEGVKKTHLKKSIVSGLITSDYNDYLITSWK